MTVRLFNLGEDESADDEADDVVEPIGRGIHDELMLFLFEFSIAIAFELLESDMARLASDF